MVEPKPERIPNARGASFPRVEPEWPEGEALRSALARGDTAMGRIGPILGHLLATREHSLFSDEIVARVRGMLTHLAWQILRVQAEATGVKAREEFAADHGEAFSEHLFGVPALVAHCHALALEWQLTMRLEETAALDPVLSPLLQSLVGHDDPTLASAGMAVLAAQARFAQTQRRMELPVSELPGDLVHELLLCWRAFNGGLDGSPERVSMKSSYALEESSDALVRAEGRIRSGFDEAAGRLSLLDRVVTALGRSASEALVIDQAGVAVLLSALALRSGQARDIVAVSTNERQQARLALGLRAAGLKPQDIEAQMLRVHPDRAPPEGLADIGTREALQILSRSAAWTDR